MNASTEVLNDSYGWCTSTSCSRIAANRSGASSSLGANRGLVTGAHGSSFRSGRSIA